MVETRASHRPPAHTATTTAKLLISAMTGVVASSDSMRPAMAAGFVGILSFELHLPDGGSLKAKRKHLLHTKAQLERRFGASVAEVDFHDRWQRSRLTMAIVRREHNAVQQALVDAESYLSGQEYDLVGSTRTVLSVESDLPVGRY